MGDVYTWLAWAVAGLMFVMSIQIMGVSMTLIAIVVGLVVLTLVAYGVGRRVRRAHDRREPRFRPTDEVFRDPATGRTTRVHTDDSTGERRYWQDR